MTEEEFREIIKPIGLIGKKENRTFIETALIGNFKMWLEEKQALDLATVTYCAKCDKEGDGYGIRGELCKECDHIMRLDAM